MRRSPFFDGVTQCDVTIVGQAGKFPIFYYDGFGLTALFPARLGALRKLVPDPEQVPARLAPGIGIVGVSTFEYRDADIGPYNEVAITVVLKAPGAIANLPGQAAVGALRSGRFHTYVHHLPVTTEVARAGGVDFYNFPKFIAAIDFSEEAGRIACRLAEGEEHILTLRAPRVGGRKPGQFSIFSHQWMDGQSQGAEFKINATDLGMTSKLGAADLELGGRHPIALELKDLLLSRRSLNYQCVSRFEAILYGPERMSLSLLKRAQEALSGAESLQAS